MEQVCQIDDDELSIDLSIHLSSFSLLSYGDDKVKNKDKDKDIDKDTTSSKKNAYRSAKSTTLSSQ